MPAASLTALRGLCAGALLCLGTAPHAATLYDPTLGTLPAAQGWAFAAFPAGGAAQAVGGGVLSFATTAAGNATQAGFGRADQVLDTAGGFRLEFTLRVLSETHANNDRAGFSLLMVGSDASRALELAFWDDEVWVYALNGANAFVHGATLTLDTTVTRDYRLTVAQHQWSLAVDGVTTALTGALVDYRAPVVFPDPYEIPNTLFFGDDTSSAQSSVALGRIALAPVPLPAAGWLLLAALPLLRRVRT